MKCENCEKEHDGSYGSGRFCDTKCARGFSTKNKRSEINKKVSKANKGKKYKRSEKCPTYDLDKWRKKLQITVLKKQEAIKETLDFEEWPSQLQRNAVFEEQNGNCNKCGLDEWMGEIIPLELEHKDGNNRNNKRENLEFLCCNCHALTTTWRGRNKSNTGKQKVSDEELQEAIKNTSSIRQALILVGLSPKGNNYSRAKKLGAVV